MLGQRLTWSTPKWRATLWFVAALAVAAGALGAAPPAASAKRVRRVVVERRILKVREAHDEVKRETVSVPQVGMVGLNKVGVIKIRPTTEHAPNVLVLEPGTSAAAAYFVPFAKSLVEVTRGWQVWAVERRENFLEDQQELTRYKFGELPAEEENPNTKKDESPPEQFFNYYLGYLGQDESEAVKKATEEVTANVESIARAAVTEKVVAIAKAEVNEYVVAQVTPQAFEETGGTAPEFEERVAVLAEEYAAAHRSELTADLVKDSEKYAAEHAAELEKDGQEFGENYAKEHATELAEEGQKIGEKIFAELVAEFHNHYQPVANTSVEFAKQWGMSRAIADLNVVIARAKALGGKVVLGGHSLGGSVVTAYATWDFAGKPGAEGLAGLVYDDGGSSPVPISEAEAETSLAKLDEAGETPWLAFGGIVAPDLGLFSASGSTLALVEPKGPSQLEKFPFLPADLRGPITPVTNEAGFGFSVNVGTSPASLIAAQIHGGAGVEEAAEGDGLHGWNGSGALTPVSRYAEMLSGTGLREASGSEWYFPARLTLDTGAVGNGLENPAQKVLGLHATMGDQLPRSLHILAIDSELDKLFGGTQTTLTEAEALAEQSGIPKENLTLIEEKESYAHNDPAGATPESNEFFKKLRPFLEAIAH